MIRRLIFGVALLTAVVGAVWFYQSASLTSRAGGDAAVYSVRRFDPYGTAALRDLLIERGAQVRSLESPNLHPADHGVLIQTLPMTKSIRKRYEVPVQRLMDWMADGNTVIQLSRGSTELMERLKIAPTTRPREDDEKRRTVQQFEEDGGLPPLTPARSVIGELESSKQSQPLLLWSPMTFEDDQGKSWKPMARLTGIDSGKVVAGEMSVGRGKLVIVGAPTPALNGMVGERGNLEFLLSEIGDRPVIFDEWSHGIGHEATIIGFIHEVGLVPLLVQIFLIAAIYVWSTMGHPQQDGFRPPRRRSSIEQIQTLGFLYSRSFTSEVTFNHVSAEVMRRLAGALRCRVTEVLAGIKALKPELRGKCEALLQQLNRLRPAHGPRCTSCGYDLYLLTSDRCPECGANIPLEMRRRIGEASRGLPPGATESKRTRFDQAFAQVLTLSHELSQEVHRDRRAL